MASKALVVGAYQQKLAEIVAHPSVESLIAVVPPSWQEPGGRLLTIERSGVGQPAYELRVEPIVFNGNFHLFFWPGLGRAINESRADVVHLDEEPYNLATALGAWHARRAGARVVFFSWQNLPRRYPPPFSLFEGYVHRAADHAIAGNQEAVAVLRAKGYRGPISVIPQFGVDPELFQPARPSTGSGRTDQRQLLTIAFVGRLVEEKGLLVLLDALQEVTGEWRLKVVGSGPLLGDARARAARLGLDARIDWLASVPSTDMPDLLRSVDILVLPSLTRPHWKEQFGRALVESMACEVAVVGSDSGEIPAVIGDAGLVVREGSVSELAAALQRLLADAALRVELGGRGRRRVLERFTHARIAAETVAVYQDVLARRRARTER